jgi:hypothetical protein
MRFLNSITKLFVVILPDRLAYTLILFISLSLFLKNLIIRFNGR